MPTILPTQRTLLLYLFFYFSTNNGEGVEGGGGVKCEKVESMFNQELTPMGPRPNLILFDPLHCYKKFIHAVGDHHWPRKIYGWSAQPWFTDGWLGELQEWRQAWSAG
jgi:hypothetical protein